MISALFFNFFMQKASWIKDIHIFNFSIYGIKKTLASKSTTNFAKKLLIKYYNFVNIFSRADSDKLSPHPSYNSKIFLIEKKTLFWRLLYSMS